MKIYNSLRKYHSYYKTDIFLASFPKSGNTWIRFVIANILKGLFQLNEDVSFANIGKYVPSFVPAHQNYYSGVEYFPVIKKVHYFNNKYNYFNKVFGKKIIYIIRNPCDVMRSYYLYTYAEGNDLCNLTFNQFIEENIALWVDNVNTFAEVSSLVLSYDKAMNNTIQEMEGLKVLLEECIQKGISDELLKQSIDLSCKKNMIDLEMQAKSNADNGLLFDTFMINKNYNFVNENESRNVSITDSDINIIMSGIDGIADPIIRNGMLGVTKNVISAYDG